MKKLIHKLILTLFFAIAPFADLIASVIFLAYVALACSVFFIFGDMNVFSDVNLQSIPFLIAHIAYIFVTLLTLVLLVVFLSKPLFSKWVENHLFDMGLKNEARPPQSPAFVELCYDMSRPHGYVMQVENRGLSVEDVQEKAPRLEAFLNSQVGDIVASPDGPAWTNIHVIPFKYAIPDVISWERDLVIQDIKAGKSALVIGQTGSGKSFAMDTLLRGIACPVKTDAGIIIPSNVSITICAYKRGLFTSYSQYPNFYGYNDVVKGIEDFHRVFLERLDDDILCTGNPAEDKPILRVLCIDEYGAMISALDKGGEIKKMVGNMAKMGRELGIVVLIGTQTAHNESFDTGARDQFRLILGMGNLSKIQKEMVFGDWKNRMTAKNSPGEGYLLYTESEEGLHRVKVKYDYDYQSAEKDIGEAMSR